MAFTNTDKGHEMINVSIIIMLCKLFKKVEVYAPKKCCDNLFYLLEEIGFQGGNLQFINVDNTFRRSIPRWIYGGFSSFYYLLSTSKKDVVFFSTINPFAFPLLNFISKHRGIKMIHLCHNDLEYLWQEKHEGINLHYHLINYIFKKMILAPSTFFLVLGDSIKVNIENYVREQTYQQIFSMMHPYMAFPHIENNYQLSSIADIKIGIVGTVYKNKGWELLKSLDKILALFPHIQVFFSSVAVDCDLTELKNINNLNANSSQLDRGIYNSIISQMDYLFFPYPYDSYKLSASGAVYEAIVNSKPIIAPKNDYFDFLFQRFGKMGFLYENEDKLKSVFASLDVTEKELMISNMIKAQEYIAPFKYYTIWGKLLKENCKI